MASFINIRRSLSVFAVILFLTVSSQAAVPVLTWSAPTLNSDNSPVNDLAFYRVKRSTVSGNYNTPVTTTVPASSTTLNLTGINPGIKYYFVVTAVDSSGNESIPSNETNYVLAVNLTPTPTPSPTLVPTITPTSSPTASPTAKPTSAPTSSPTPSASPTASPRPTDVSNTAALDIDGDFNSDLVISNGSKVQAFSSLFDPSLVNSFESSLGAGKYTVGVADIDADGIFEIISTQVTSRGLTWTSMSVDGTKKQSLGTFGKRTDLPLIGCQSASRAIQAVLTSANGKQTLSVRGRTGILMKAPLTSAFCSHERNSRVIGFQNLAGKKYLITMSLSGSVLSKTLVPTGLLNQQIVLVPEFGLRKEKIVLIAKQKGAFELFSLDEATYKFSKLSLGAKLGTVTGAMGGVFKGKYGFVLVKVGDSIRIIPFDGGTSTYSIPQLVIPSGMKIVK